MQTNKQVKEKMKNEIAGVVSLTDVTHGKLNIFNVAGYVSLLNTSCDRYSMVNTVRVIDKQHIITSTMDGKLTLLEVNH
jgi:hypothetical protein